MKHKLERILPTNRGYALLLLTGIIFVSLIAGHFPGASAESGESGKVEISGSIISLPATTGFIGEWTVTRSTIVVTSATKIEGTPAVGAYIEVEGTRQSGGKISALKIEVKYGALTGTVEKFNGRIESLPSTPGRTGQWAVSGRTIVVTDMTRIKQEAGAPAVGTSVSVTGSVGADRVFTASEIETQRESSGSTQLEFTGVIEQIPDPIRPGDWTVSGRTVTIGTATRIKEEAGRAIIGSVVEVKGQLESTGKVAATEIEVKKVSEVSTGRISFRGSIEALPAGGGTTGDWKVSGRTVRVTSSTRINREIGSIAVGAAVVVTGSVDSAGLITASGISLTGEATTTGYIKFIGTVSSIVPQSTASGASSLIGQWKVGERTLSVTAATKIDQEDGTAQVGAFVEVEATTLADGTLVAKSIEVKRSGGTSSNYIKFSGAIEALPAGGTLYGAWTVAGRTVNVSTTTRLRQEKGDPVVGAFVEVAGNVQTGNVVDAFVIEVGNSTESSSGASGYVDFYGEIKSLPALVGGKYLGEWTIGTTDRRVIVAATTRIDTERAEIKVGGYVEVKGYSTATGAVNATKIEARPAPTSGGAPGSLPEPGYVEFKGTVTSLPDTINYVGQWVVDGTRKVNVGQATRIKREGSRVEVGAVVEVTGAELPTGEIDAKYLEISSSQSGSSFVAFNPFTSVNAGSYQAGNSGSSIIAGFGSNLATGVATASSLPLPTTLGGVSVMVDGRPAGLFYVSPTQINYQAPDQLLPGSALVTVLRNSQVVAQGTLTLDATAPSIFTADGSGLGAPAGQLLRVTASGQLLYEPLARYDAAKSAIVPVPIVRQPGDKLFLVFYGTGLSEMEDSDDNASNGVAEHIEALLGDKPMKVLYTGVAPGFAGLDQINIELPDTLTGTFQITIKVNDGEGKVLSANQVTITIN